MPRWGEIDSTNEAARRDPHQSDVKQRSVNRRVLRAEDSLFTYDDDTLTPVGDRNIASDVTGNLTGNVTGNLTGNVTGDLIGDVDGRVFSTAVLKTANYTITDDDGDYVEADPTSADVTLTLPTAADNDGRTIYIRHTGTANNVILDGEGGEQVDGATTMTLEDGGSWAAIRCDGTKWTWAAGKILGSNPNGNYVVFSSGLQVCWDSRLGSNPSTTSNRYGSSSGTRYYGTAGVTFPRAFAATPVVTGASITNAVGAVARPVVISTTSSTWLVEHPVQSQTVAFDWIAIGEAG